jgi:hypothetical protein
MTNNSPKVTARRIMGLSLATLLPVLAAGFIGLSAAPASAMPVNNQTLSPTGSGSNVTSFTLVLVGDVLPLLGVSGNWASITVPSWGDPFCTPSGNDCTVNVTYNATLNQSTLLYRGSYGLFSNVGQGETGYHFGYVIVKPPPDGQPCNYYIQIGAIVSGTWTYISGPATHLATTPNLSVDSGCPPPPKNGYSVGIVYYEAQFAKATLPMQSWNVVLYSPGNDGAQPKIAFSNYTKEAIRVSNTGIVLGLKEPTNAEGWETLISMMNAVDMPPPGTSGSPFQMLSKPPPGIIKPTKLSPSDLAHLWLRHLMRR